MAVPQSFPAKIYQILENESPEIISWNENGVSFRIVDHGRFEREIVPKYFRHNQISSVQRQLNLYGFKCISRGEFKRSFFHPKFRRGDWETVRKLTRYIPLKKSSDKADDNSPSPEAVTEGNTATEDRSAPQQLMYPPYFFPLPPQGHAGAPQNVMQFMQNQPGHPAPHVIVPHPHAHTMGMWHDSWNQHQHLDNGQYNAKSAGFSPQFTYAAMPMQPHAYQQAHLHQIPAPSTSSAQSTQPADSKQQSELSNRLGFKWPATEEQSATTASKSTENTDAGSGAHTSKQQDASLPLVSVNHNNVVTVNPDYDFMVEFGMFDSLHLPELINSAMSGHAGDHAGSKAAPATSSTTSSYTSSDDFAPAHPAHSYTSAAAPALAAVPVAAKEYTVSVPAVGFAVPVVAHRPAGKDVGCNTLLTFSKLHDALVVLHPELELK